MSTVAEPAVRVRDLVFAWRGMKAPVLSIAHFEVAPGECVFLHGPSGSGKSTLLGLMAGVIAAPPGALGVLGRDPAALGARGRDRLRADGIGYVFQQFNLLPYVSALENVMLPCRFSAARRERARVDAGSVEAAAAQLLGALGIDGAQARRAPGALSVGQQQRVAVARALIGAPALVLADEPTSALDADLGHAFVLALVGQCRARRAALVFVSHDLSLAAAFDRSVSLPAVNAAAGVNA